MNHTLSISNTSADRPVVARSRTGCWTCRLKKVKCDEAQPQCQRCRRLRRLCDYGPRPEADAQLNKSRRLAKAKPGELTLQLPPFGSSACSVTLSAADHEAIRHFRTTFARRHHTKNPDFSVFSIMFTIAEREPLVMHTLLALGCRDIESRRQHSSATGQVARRQSWSHLLHYSCALRSLTEELARSDTGHEAFSFDVCCTALYLMLLYEQNYGDAGFLGLANHLRGAAMILRHRGCHIKSELETLRFATPSALSCRKATPSCSLYSARILIWISLCDSVAATYGIGGAFNQALHEMLDCSGPRGIARLHSFSNPLFRTIWGASYPQAELTDDIENRSVFELVVSCSQARYALALLAHTLGGGGDDAGRDRCIQSAKAAIQFIAVQFRELLEVADGLLPATDNSHRLVANLRDIVPHYHAAVVLFARLTGDQSVWFGRMEPGAHMNSIMSLVRQTHRHEGNEVLMRVAWPLLVVALETQDQRSRDWIMCRFQALSSLNRNMKHAADFLSHHTAPRGASAPWTEPGNWFRSADGNLFVL